MKKAFIPLAFLLVLILLFTACGETVTPTTTTPSSSPSIKPNVTTATATPKTGGTLRIVYQYSPASTPGWPGDTTNPQVLWTFWVTFEGLVKLDALSEPIPWLATDWEWGPDRAYLDFNLRQDVNFSDGTKFTADSVVANLEQLFADQNSVTTNWDHVEKTGDYSCRLYLKTYMRDFWGNFGSVYFVSDTMLKEQGLDYVKEHPCGTGPFLFSSFEKEVSLKFVKNPDYWQPGKPYLDAIEFYTTKEALTQQAKMESNEGDVLTLQTGQILQTLGNAGLTVITQTGSSNFIMFDTANEGQLTNDPMVRQAIEYAINKQEMADALGYGGMTPSNQIHMKGNPAYVEDLGEREYDPDKARDLLSKAGYPDGLVLTLISENSGQDFAIMLQDYLKAVGITLNLDMVDNAKLWDYLLNGWNGMISTGYAAGTSLANFLRTYFPPVGVFDVSVKIPDDIVEKANAAMVELDDAKYEQMCRELSQWVWDNAFFVPTVGVAMGYVIRPEVRDADFLLKYSSFITWSPENCWLDR